MFGESLIPTGQLTPRDRGAGPTGALSKTSGTRAAESADGFERRRETSASAHFRLRELGGRASMEKEQLTLVDGETVRSVCSLSLAGWSLRPYSFPSRQPGAL